VFCAEDWLMPQPRYSRMFTAGLPHASVTTLTGVGHVPALESPELVAELIRTHIEAVPSSETA
jgi:pimeloyl-ACP methyl ester carboxylesterase